jgi:hypothetical protein
MQLIESKLIKKFSLFKAQSSPLKNLLVIPTTRSLVLVFWRRNLQYKPNEIEGEFEM